MSNKFDKAYYALNARHLSGKRDFIDSIFSVAALRCEMKKASNQTAGLSKELLCRQLTSYMNYQSELEITDQWLL